MNKKLLTLICILCTALFSTNTFADGGFHVGKLTARVVVSSSAPRHPVFFGISPQPSDTCSYWGEHFLFDGTTSGGKNMLATLLLAKTHNYEVNVWYTPSTMPGTDQTADECNELTIAKLLTIAIVNKD